MSEPATQLTDIRAGRNLSVFDVCSINALSPADITLVHELARAFRSAGAHKFNFCRGQLQMNAFFEASTRTLSSFDLAGKQLSFDTHNISSNSSSVKKGESFLDTAQSIDAYGLSILIVRSAESGVPEMLAKHTAAAVLNAGDGWHEHPSQALLDTLTMLDAFHTDTLAGRTVCLVGDFLHSRVMGSLVRILPKLGADVRVACPHTLLPAHAPQHFGFTHYINVEAALEGADVVYAQRLQAERGAGGFIPTVREYSKRFGISRKRLDIANPGALLMNPGPVMRDIEIHSALAAVDPQSHILQQVENGLAIRKALLWLLGSRTDDAIKPYARA